MALPDERPGLTADMKAAEFTRWYWLRDELAGFARVLGVRASGSKELLTARLAAHLEGIPFVEPASVRSPAPQMVPPFAPDDVIPAGQRCSQGLRGWFEAEVGPAFRFDGPMRTFIARADGTQTLADAVGCWHASRSGSPTAVDAQFEYNRFTRRWHEDHPDGDSADLRAAWWTYRSLPVDRRGRI